jgi:hypothetical protein
MAQIERSHGELASHLDIWAPEIFGVAKNGDCAMVSMMSVFASHDVPIERSPFERMRRKLLADATRLHRAQP